MFLQILPGDLLLNAVNVLKQCFLEGRVKGKRLFRELKQGQVLQVARLELDGQQLQVELQLDHSAFQGSLAYSVFYDYLERFLFKARDRIINGQPVNDFSNDDGTEILFHLPTTSPKDACSNVFVIGVLQPEPGVLRIVMQYLDPAQFDPGDN